MSNFETVKEISSLKAYAEAHLEKVRGGFVCPVCKSGTGANKTPGFSIKGNNWKCFSCDSGGDIFDLAGYIYSTDSQKEQLEKVAAWGNIPLENNSPLQVQPKKEQSKSNAKIKPDYKQLQEKESTYIKKCQENIKNYPEALEYLLNRGFTEFEINLFKFGYDPQNKRVVIPWLGSDYYHIDRDITGKANNKYKKPKSEEVGEQPLYNPEALNKQAYFIVEGILDALAIRACGYEAISLMGTANRSNLEKIYSINRKGIGIVLLDNDEPGQKAQAALLEELERLSIISIGETLPNQYKDACEWLKADRKALESFLEGIYLNSVDKYQEIKEQAYNKAMEGFRAKNPLDVATSLFLGEYYEPSLSTGIKELDRVLGGGLKSGLYCLGAVSSLGKTTLALQIADTIAATGRKVLFVTIEQSAGELVAKSLSRYVYKTSNGKESIPTSEIIGSSNQAQLVRQESLAKACELYSYEVAPNLRILEGTEQPSVIDVRKVAEYMKTYNGVAPVIFIDYLQLMAPKSERDTDKQAIDKNVMSLRQLSRDLKTPVFVISSLNRSSYSEGVTMDAFKESGAIEYGTDVLLGLQPKGLLETIEKTKDQATKREAAKHTRKHKSVKIRECELIVLKNRNGMITDKGIPLTFDTVSSIFKEDTAQTEKINLPRL